MKKEEFNKIFQKYFDSENDSEFFDIILDELKKIEEIPDKKTREDLYELTTQTIERHFELKKMDIRGTLVKFFEELNKTQKISNTLYSALKGVNKYLEATNKIQRKAEENLGLSNQQSN